jgi:polar amino acid transport system substrate-binding protein
MLQSLINWKRNQAPIGRAFCSLFLAACLINATSQPTQAEQDTCDTLNVGGGSNMYPISYITATTKQPAGIGYQLALQLGKAMGIPVKFNFNFPWSRTISMAQSGEIDIVAGMIFTSEREKYLHFTIPFYRENLYAYAHRNTKLRLTRVEDLVNYKRVAVRGNSQGKELENLLMPTTMLVNERSQLIALILSGRADYFFITPSEFSKLKQKYAGVENIKKLPLPISKLEAMLAVSKNSPCAKYLSQFNRIIAELDPLGKSALDGHNDGD